MKLSVLLLVLVMGVLMEVLSAAVVPLPGVGYALLLRQRVGLVVARVQRRSQPAGVLRHVHDPPSGVGGQVGARRLRLRDVQAGRFEAVGLQQVAVDPRRERSLLGGPVHDMSVPLVPLVALGLRVQLVALRRVMRLGVVVRGARVVLVSRVAVVQSRVVFVGVTAEALIVRVIVMVLLTAGGLIVAGAVAVVEALVIVTVFVTVTLARVVIVIVTLAVVI